VTVELNDMVTAVQVFRPNHRFSICASRSRLTGFPAR